jgi:hypothetical protein
MYSIRHLIRGGDCAFIAVTPATDEIKQLVPCPWLDALASALQRKYPCRYDGQRGSHAAAKRRSGVLVIAAGLDRGEGMRTSCNKWQEILVNL